jgi:hypothetical protein
VRATVGGPGPGSHECSQPPKELPSDVRLAGEVLTHQRVRGMLAGAATVGEPRLAGGIGCRGVLSTDVPRRPCNP